MVIWGTTRTHVLKFLSTQRPLNLYFSWFFDGDNLKFNKYPGIPPKKMAKYLSNRCADFFLECTHHVGHPIPWVIHLGFLRVFYCIPEFCFPEQKASCAANPSSWVQKSAPQMQQVRENAGLDALTKMFNHEEFQHKRTSKILGKLILYVRLPACKIKMRVIANYNF